MVFVDPLSDYLAFGYKGVDLIKKKKKLFYAPCVCVYLQLKRNETFAQCDGVQNIFLASRPN